MGSLKEIYADKVQLCIDHHISNVNYAQKTLLESSSLRYLRSHLQK